MANPMLDQALSVATALNAVKLKGARLASCADGVEIRAALGQVENLTKTQRKRLRRHLAILVEDGAIIRCNEWIDILPYGERLLDELEAQTPVGYSQPSVRYFERRAA